MAGVQVAEPIIRKIYFLRGHKVMLDKDLAELYGVNTKVFNQAVKRNSTRFPSDFMFQINDFELESVRSQFVTLEKDKFEHFRYNPYAFTENGISMLSSVLNSETAIQVNISILRLFNQMRHVMFENKELILQLTDIEKNVVDHDHKIEILFRYIQQFLEEKTEVKPYESIGFKQKYQTKE